MDYLSEGKGKAITIYPFDCFIMPIRNTLPLFYNGFALSPVYTDRINKYRNKTGVRLMMNGDNKVFKINFITPEAIIEKIKGILVEGIYEYLNEVYREKFY